MTIARREFRDEELLADVIARLIGDVRHVAVGNASPIPATAALLARERGNGRPYVSLLGSPKNTFWTDGARELFDCAGQGRIDVFFLSGGQIDGQGNVNLVSTGDYAHPKVRFPGSFGSAYLYYVVPKVILFRVEHSRRTLVPKVDFISAPGASEQNVYRPGGPIALVSRAASVVSLWRTEGPVRMQRAIVLQSSSEGHDARRFLIYSNTALPDSLRPRMHLTYIPRSGFGLP